MVGRPTLQGARSSLRRQYLLSLASIVIVCTLVAVLCAAAVVWATNTVQDSADRVTQLQLANRDIRQNMSDASAALNDYVLSADAVTQAPFNAVKGWLPLTQRRLRVLAGGDPELLEAAAKQESAIEAWEANAEQAFSFPQGADVQQQRLAQNNAYFGTFSDANDQVALEIAELVEKIQARTEQVTILVLAGVILLPAVTVAWVVTVGRRMGDNVVRPLSDISGVLERLRAGDLEARAEVQGPEEIRQIAAALNLLTDENIRAVEVEADVLNQLEAIDRVRTDLVSTVSHELRTPLTSIAGYLELLQDELADELSSQQLAMMAAIRRNLDRLTELIENLLALSRAEETTFAMEPVDLRGIASEVASDVRLTAAARDITVRTQLPPVPVVVLGDRSQLIRAVQNLVTNAVKFSRQGGVVDLRVLQAHSEAVLEVADEGIGIPAADLPGLGSRFYRARNAVKAEISGTGLGLRIVQTILDRHEGSLAVDSVEGEGARFTFRLPTSSRPFAPMDSTPALPSRGVEAGAAAPMLSRD
jgi:two-component system, OmpR family, sensor kinase